jgi:hypothetical protein
MPESVLTQTIPLLADGGACDCAAGSARVDEAEDLGVLAAVVGAALLVAGVDGAAADPDGALPSAVALSCAVDFLVRGLFATAVSAPPGFASPSACLDVWDGLAFALVALSAAAESSGAAPADFFDRLLLAPTAPEFWATVASFAEAALCFLLPESLPPVVSELPAVSLEAEDSDASALFFERFVFVADPPLSAAVESALTPFRERLFLASEKSAPSVLFVLGFDLVCLAASVAVESPAWSVLAFFFLGVVELSF